MRIKIEIAIRVKFGSWIPSASGIPPRLKSPTISGMALPKMVLPSLTSKAKPLKIVSVPRVATKADNPA